jgi:hypothetical protein
MTTDAPWEDRPHRIEGQTLLDGQPVQRRVQICDRSTGIYVNSTVSRVDGTFAFRHLPPQDLAHPYVVGCFDDRPTDPGNALVFDHVYQVDDVGNPPQT